MHKEGRKIKSVAVLCHSLKGGVGSSIYNLRKALCEEGVRLDLFTFEAIRYNIEEACDERVVILDKRGIYMLCRDVIKGKYDVIYATSTVTDSLVFGLLFELSKELCPILVVHHGSRSCDLARYRGLCVCGVSPESLTSVSSSDDSYRDILPNIVETCFDQKVQVIEGGDSRVPLLWVGRTKGIDVYDKDPLGFLALSLVLPSSQYYFIMVDGDGDEESSGCDSWFREHIKYYKGLKRSEVLQQMDFVARKCGALVMTSRSEGCPMAVLEAWSVGCPVIVPDVNGFSIVHDNINGFKYCREGGINSIVDRLSALRDRSHIAKVVAQGSKYVCDNHSSQSVAGTFLRIVEKLSEHNSSSREVHCCLNVVRAIILYFKAKLGLRGSISKTCS